MVEAPAEVAPIVVAGRKFHPAFKTTFEQDFFVIDLVSESGVQKLAIAKDEKLEKIAEEVILTAYRSGNLFRLLAGMVVEEGKKWTVKSAEDNAIFFSELTDPDDKRGLQDALVGVLLSFFVNAEGFSKTSAKSSGVTLEPKPEPQESRAVPTGAVNLGQTSSEVLQNLTLMSTNESPGGQ